MEPLLGSIMALPYTFAPQGWLACDGSILSISQNTALFSLIGVTFGGNGTTTFNLPDIRSRAIVGSSVNVVPGLTTYAQGATGGVESVSLLTTEMPSHIHTALIANANAPVTGSMSATLNVASGGGNAAPVGNFLAGSTSNGDNMYATGSSGATLNAGSVTVSPSGMNATLTNVPVTVAPAGGSMPHENRMPFIAIQYCIATQGVYPSRP